MIVSEGWRWFVKVQVTLSFGFIVSVIWRVTGSTEWGASHVNAVRSQWSTAPSVIVYGLPLPSGPSRLMLRLAGGVLGSLEVFSLND